jgi:hypothetical protein
MDLTPLKLKCETLGFLFTLFLWVQPSSVMYYLEGRCLIELLLSLLICYLLFLTWVRYL